MKATLQHNLPHLSKVNVERCGAVIKRRIQDQQELAGSTPASIKCCVWSTDMLSSGFYPGRPARNTHKMRVSQYIYIEKQAWANRVCPDQTPQNAASGQGIHCLPLIQQSLGTSKSSEKYVVKQDKYGKWFVSQYIAFNKSLPLSGQIQQRYFSYFSQKIGFDISYNFLLIVIRHFVWNVKALFPEIIITIKNVSKRPLLKLLPRMLSVN